MPNISFQVEFTPSSSQKGKTPELVSAVKIFGEDQWTKESLETSTSSINTTLPDDQTISEGQGVVQ